jgi:protoporphyrinogen oxidase
MQSDVLIVGGGVTGLGTALRLKVDACLYEKEKQLGGCLRSDYKSGYTIDRTGHLMHFRDQYVQGVIDRLSIEWIHFNRKSEIFIQSRRVPYPIQYHLHALPMETRLDCLMSYLDTLDKQPSLQDSFEQWSRSSFGDRLHELFFAPYNSKLWQADLNSFNAEWTQRFVAMPDRELIVRGALGCHLNEAFGYNATFSYPRKGGSQAIVDALAAETSIPIRTGVELVAVDPMSRTCEFSDGSCVHYRSLVSSLPLPQLLRIVHNVDSKILEISTRLRHNSLLYFAFGYENYGENPSEHWVYFPESQFLMYRVGVLSNYSSEVAPRGSILLCAEIAFPGGSARYADPEALRQRVVADLISGGIVQPNWTKNFEHHGIIDCAYVIFDQARRDALPRILAYLRGLGIHSVGRYGAWGYGSIGDALIEGRDCAEAINLEFRAPSASV